MEKREVCSPSSSQNMNHKGLFSFHVKRFSAFHFLSFLYGKSKTLKSLVSGFDLNLII